MSVAQQVDQTGKWEDRVDNSLQRREVEKEYRRKYEYCPSVEEDQRVYELMLSIIHDIFTLI